MFLALPALVLIGYLPGALLLRAPTRGRAARAALAVEERAFWGVVLSVAWSLAATLGMAAVGAYTFGRLLAVDALACAAIVVAWRGRLRHDPPAAPVRRSVLVPLAVVAYGLWTFFPPAEYVMGGKDPGTYMNEGVQIAQRGGLVIHDPTVAKVPEATRDLFFPSHNSTAYYSVRFMGFFLQDPRAATVVGQFPHLFPASIAIGYGVNGLSGARQAVGAWAILGLLAVYLVGARLLGTAPAAAATALLAVNVITAWFSRYPNAELAMQALAFAGLLALARALVDGQRFFAPVSAVLLALLLFLRIDAGLAAAAACAAILLGRLVGARIAWTFWPVLGAGAAAAWLYYTRVLSGYLAVPTLYVRETVPVPILAAAAVAAIGAFLWLSRLERAARVLRRALPLVLAAALVGLAAYAFFFREAVGKTAWHDAMALRSFAWYIGGYGLALAVAGAAVWSVRLFWRDPGTLLTVAAFACFFFYKIRIVPEHFWMTRRFLPIILPGTMLAIAGLAAWLAGPDGPRRVLRRRPPTAVDVPAWQTAAALAVMVAVTAPVAVRSWYQARPVRHHVEYAGLIPQIEKLANRFADDDLVLVESRNASDLHVLALPLAYIYARPVLVLNTPRPDKPMMEAFIADARTKYREVFFLGSGGTDLLTRRIGVEPVGSDRFQVPEYESPANAYPAGVRRKEFDYGIYRFVDVSGLVHQPQIVIGERDDLQVVRFHAKEKDPQSGRTYRWTRDVSYVSLLNVTPATRRIVLWMADGRRPARAGAAELELSLGEHVLGTVVVGPDMRPYEFLVPPEVADEAARSDEPARLRLRVNTWSPRKLLGAPDDRDLGVMLARVDVGGSAGG